MDHWGLWLARLLAALFLLNSLANLANLKPLREEFARWRLPRWFRFFNAAWQAATAALLTMPQTLLPGLVMAFGICIGIVAIVGVRAREYGHCTPGAILAALLCVVAAAPH